MAYLSPAVLLAIVTLALLFAFFFHYASAIRPKPGTVEWIQRAETGPMTFSLPCRPMTRRDALPLLVITAVYAVTAFWHLGSFRAPQSAVEGKRNVSYTLTLAEPVLASAVRYFPGLGTGDYELEISADGETWLSLWTREDENGNALGYYWADGAGYSPSYAMSQSYDLLFRWVDLSIDNPQYIRHLRLTGDPNRSPMYLEELSLLDESGAPVDLSGTADDDASAPLVDEQDTVPTELSYFNSSYFDEIYHPRTALEHIEGVAPYEISHPPLGKLILGLGIRIFGMTPFGWRFMGTLFGVLMLPLLYLLLKNLFGRTALAACGTALFAFDFMHLTQTRLATIDTYGVFFILAMYYFLYRWLAQEPGSTFKQGAPWLFLSGLMWGLGAASKWTVIYGAVGLAVLFFVGLGFKLRDWPEEAQFRRVGWTAGTLAFCVLCFVLMPLAIYTLSYWPYAAAKGDTSLSNLLKVMWDNQVYMLTYHQGVNTPHPYESKWWMWLVDARPILYYMVNTPTTITRFAAFVNPVVAWGGLMAMIAVAVETVRRRSGRALFILVGFLSQLLPWVFIRRSTFAYHYFPSVLFLVLAIVFVFDELREFAPKTWRKPVYAFTAGSVALYALFYPVLTGITIPTWYATYVLRWLPSWPF